MSDAQRFGNAPLVPDQVKAIKHRYKMGGRPTNKEIEKLIETALFALHELEHQLREDVV